MHNTWRSMQQKIDDGDEVPSTWHNPDDLEELSVLRRALQDCVEGYVTEDSAPELNRAIKRTAALLLRLGAR